MPRQKADDICPTVHGDSRSEMAIDFYADENSQIVRLVLRNQSTIEEIQEKLPQLIELIGRLDEPRLLIDYVEDSEKLNPKRRAGTFLFADLLNQNIKKVAISCAPHLKQDIASVYDVMRARDVAAQFFDDAGAADVWLREN